MTIGKRVEDAEIYTDDFAVQPLQLQCKRTLFTSVEEKSSPIDQVETRFQFSILTAMLSHVVD